MDKIELTQVEADLIMDELLTHLECTEGLFSNSEGTYNVDWKVINKLMAAGFKVPVRWEECLSKIDTIKMENGGE